MYLEDSLQYGSWFREDGGDAADRVLGQLRRPALSQLGYDWLQTPAHADTREREKRCMTRRFIFLHTSLPGYAMVNVASCMSEDLQSVTD